MLKKYDVVQTNFQSFWVNNANYNERILQNVKKKYSQVYGVMNKSLCVKIKEKNLKTHLCALFSPFLTIRQKNYLC